MSTSEQRVRARKTRIADDLPAAQGVKPMRRRSGLRDVPSSWRCEGQMDLFDLDEQEGSGHGIQEL